MTHPYVWRVSFICVTWLIYMCDKTHSYVWHDTFICVTWLIHMCDVSHSYVWHSSRTRVTCMVHVCDMSHAHVRFILDSFICGTWFIHMCVTWSRINTFAMMRSYVGHDSIFTCEMIMCDMTHSYVWHVSLICMTWLIHMYDMTHSYVWRHFSLICVKKKKSHLCDPSLTRKRALYIHKRALYIRKRALYPNQKSPIYLSESLKYGVATDISHSYVWHDSFICGTWLIHMWDMTH